MKEFSLLILSLLLLPAFADSATAAKRYLDLAALSESTQLEVLEAFPSFKTSNWKLSELDLLLEFLANRGEYESLEIEQDPAKDADLFRLSIGRVRRISAIGFRGGATFSDNQLRIESGIQEKLKFDMALVRQGAERLRQFYESQGFKASQINVEVPEGPSQEVELEMVIKEGPRTLFSEFKVSAANSRFRAKTTEFLNEYLNAPYTQKNLTDLQRQLRIYLSKNRFYSASLNEPVITFSEDGAKATAFYHFERTEEYSVAIEGASRVPQFTLISNLDLDNYSSANPNLAAELSSRVRSYYLSQGYARVEVSADEKETTQNFSKQLLINVKEGPRIQVKNIEFQGNFSQPEEFYRDFVLEHSTEVLKDRFYVREDVETGLKNLINDRLNNGFLKARVVSSRFIYSKERNAITVVVQLDEGPLTQISQVSFTGNSSFTAEELSDLTGLKEGNPLRLNQLEEAIQKIKSHYLGHGYLEFALLNQQEELVVYNEDNSKVQVQFRIFEGPRILVGSIFVDGNVITKDWVVVKELEFKVGDVLTPELIDESISRLQRLGHFSQIEIKTLEEKTSISRRTVIVRVIDRDPGLLNVGAGFNNELGLTVRGYLSLGYRNIQGTGKALSARIDGNYNVTDLKFFERKVTLGYLEPYLLDTRTKGRINITRQTKVSDLNTFTDTDGRKFRKASEINQGTGSLEQDITSHWTVYWDVLTLATIRDFRFDSEGQEDAARSQGLSAVTIGSTALSTDIDFRNHPFVPTAGSFTRLSLEYGTPSLGSTGTIEYARSTAYTSHYWTVAKKWQWVWANSLRLGYLENLSKKEDGAVPFKEKGFLLGGYSSVRGFSPDEAYLNSKDFLRTDFGTNAEKFYALRGKATTYLVKTELRIPIMDSIGTAVFADYGGVKVTDSIAIPQQNRITSGLAFRYITPVGPFTVEYAWKLGLDSRRGETPGALHISFGTF